MTELLSAKDGSGRKKIGLTACLLLFMMSLNSVTAAVLRAVDGGKSK
jgi:hypothetical protein